MIGQNFLHRHIYYFNGYIINEIAFSIPENKKKHIFLINIRNVIDFSDILRAKMQLMVVEKIFYKKQFIGKE